MGSKENSSLVSEVVTLFSSMQQFRRELASIRHPEQSEDRFDTVSEQLDAIVAATEDATNKILGAIKEIGEIGYPLSSRDCEIYLCFQCDTSGSK